MSKEGFFLMRAEQVATMYDPMFTKKDAKQQGVNLVKQVLDEGNASLHDVMANIARLKEVVNSADAELRKHLPEEKLTHLGVTFTPKNGGETINYTDDEVYAELKEKLQARADKLKLAHKSKDLIYDNEGVEVPKVSTTPRKDSITITF